MRIQNSARIGLMASCLLALAACGSGGSSEDEPAAKFTGNFCAQDVAQEAEEKLAELATEGVAVFAFHPGGGWVIVTHAGNKFARNIPDACNDQLEAALVAGQSVRSIAFPPVGGDSWLIVTDQARYARNVPAACSAKIDEYLGAGREILCVAFPFGRGDDSWIVLADDTSFSRNIDDECFQIIRNLTQVPFQGGTPSRRARFVAFEPDGGWVVLADDYAFARTIDTDCFDKLNTYRQELHENALVAFDPDGQGWAVVSNEDRAARRARDEIEQFERNVGGSIIWQKMRDEGVPGVSIAVVINNERVWSAGFGHLVAGEEHAVHPESIFQAASISKVIAAIAMHRLVDDGRLSLDDDIRQYLSVSVPVRACLGTSPTTDLVLRNVLTHVSSVRGDQTTYPLSACSGFTSLGGGYGGYDPIGTLPMLSQIIAGSGPTNSDPISLSRVSGGARSYSGSGFTLLQQLVQDRTVEFYSDWTEDTLLRSMGMNDSYLRIALPTRYFQEQQVAAGHRETGDSIRTRNGATPIQRRRYPEMAAAGLYSTSNDLAQVVRMLNNDGTVDGNDILTPASRDSIALSGIGSNINGNGLTATNAYYSHGGTNEGFRCLLVGFPGLGTGVVVMTNGQGVNGRAFRRQVVQAVIDAYGW